MRKLLSVLLTIIFVISCSCLLGSAQELTPTFEVSKVSGKSGETVDVDISLKNNPGITAMQIKLNYSAKDLELVEIQDKELFDNAITHSKITRNPFIISWYANDSKNNKNNGVIATVRFRIKDNAESSDIELSYDSEDVFDSDFNNQNFQINNGKVNINIDSPKIIVSSQTGIENDIVSVKIMIENNPSITALRICAKYSADDLELLDIINGEIFDESITHSNISSNPITISWYSQKSKDCNNDGVLAILKFRIKGNAESSNIELSYDENDIFNTAFENIYFEIQNGNITVDKIRFVLGDVNCDGRIDIKDSTTIQKYILHLTTFDSSQIKAADVNSDGCINIVDSTQIQKYILKLINALDK